MTSRTVPSSSSAPFLSSVLHHHPNPQVPPFNHRSDLHAAVIAAGPTIYRYCV
ncbi:MAG: hypothetical protein HUU02_16245 [Bacteroidetes bacterium]|nr:hypothetical protein [Bacteroidota bacterium]